MNKSELIDTISEKTGASKAQTADFLSATIDSLTVALSEGEKVTLPGLGAFDLRENAERQGRNPATGEAMTIKASKTPRFKAAKALKDAVNS